MTEQHDPQPAQAASAQGLSTPGLGTDAELGQRWAELSQARASLAEVMSDDELRAFGINLDVLDERQ